MLDLSYASRLGERTFPCLLPTEQGFRVLLIGVELYSMEFTLFPDLFKMLLKLISLSSKDVALNRVVVNIKSC
jgi:hypothetical protein